MRTDEFWALVDEARTGADSDVTAIDVTAIAVRAAGLLAQRDPAEIVAFDRHLRRVLAASYQVDLLGAAYLINGGASDDGFDHFRGWLIGHGRAVFARAVAEPDSLAELPAVRQAALTGEELYGEDLLRVAQTAYGKVTATDLPPHDDPPAAAEPGEPWDFDDDEEARRRLPRLAALFLEPPQE